MPLLRVCVTLSATFFVEEEVLFIGTQFSNLSVTSSNGKHFGIIQIRTRLSCLDSLKKNRGFGRRVHCGLEVTELSTNKQRTLSPRPMLHRKAQDSSCLVPRCHAL